MKVFLTPTAAQRIRSLAPETKRRVKRAILELPIDPAGDEHRLDVKRLVGHAVDDPVYRLRVGDWRVVYRIHANRIEVVRVFPRSEGYGWMDRFGF